MANPLYHASITPRLNHHPHGSIILCPNYQRKFNRIRCTGENSSSKSPPKKESESENALLKVAWYSSELLGVAASFFRSPSSTNAAPQKGVKLAVDELGSIDRATVVEAIKDDFQRSYFVTGNLTLDAYEEDCEFADPAGSFKGLKRFKRNCTNFGLLIQKSNMKLMKWEDFEDKGIGHWRFSCIMSFPWKPILSATGYTEYYFNAESGRVCRTLECTQNGTAKTDSETQPEISALVEKEQALEVEHWNVPKASLSEAIKLVMDSNSEMARS